MADERKAGRAETLAEMASRIPPLISGPQGESYEAELRIALKKAGLDPVDPDQLAMIARAYRALLVVRAKRLGDMLGKEALRALLKAHAPQGSQDVVLEPHALSGLGDPETASGTESAPANGESEGTLCS